ncbi:hypothetical protein REPUB_Repub12eG0063300 [Reevesia pubescens]
MQAEFEISRMRELTLFLDPQIKQYEDEIYINQTKYIKDMLKKFGVINAKQLRMPVSTSTKLDKDERGNYVNQNLYRGMIGSLIYLTFSIPNILFIVCLCARFQSCPKESHLIAVKMILG